MKKKSPQVMTLDSLATLIQGEFLVIRDKFADVDKRFDGVDEKFAEVDKRFDEVHGEIRELRQIVNRIDMRTQNQVDLIYEENTTMKKDMKGIKKDMSILRSTSQKNTKDIKTIKAHVGMKR